MWRTLLIFAFLTGLSACRQSADEFFSGRPSGMATVHNRIIGGSPETMVALLQVPARFPDATAAHIADWQESVIAWWGNAEKHDLLVASLGKITPEEARVLLSWVLVETPYRSVPKAAALKEIAAAVREVRGEADI
jgi:hypothetical protein